MTTPLLYMAHWFRKHEMEVYSSDRIYASKLSSTCLSIDRLIFERVGSRERDAYLDYFCLFNNFQDLCRDLNYQEEFFMFKIAEVFNQKFPMDRAKLIRMWNLKPRGIISYN